MSKYCGSRPSREITNGTWGMFVLLVSGSPFPGREGGGKSRLLRVGLLGEHFVDDAELLGLVGMEVAVAFRLAVDHVGRLAGVLGNDLVQPATVFEHLLGFNLEVG